VGVTGVVPAGAGAEFVALGSPLSLLVIETYEILLVNSPCRVRLHATTSVHVLESQATDQPIATGSQ